MESLLKGKPVSRYFRLSKKEERRDQYAVARQHFQLDQAARLLGDDPPDDRFLFEDMESGRNDDRADFQRLLKVVESRETRCVVVTRLDRITRDLETNARLVKIFQRTGVGIYTTLLGRCYDFNDPNDWRAFVNAGVDAEGESRMLAARIRATTSFMRHMGRVCGGKTSLGYRRSSDKTYEPDPDEWEMALAIVEKFLECQSALMVSRWLKTELGISWSYQGISRWLQNPLLRGHTAYFWDHDSRHPNARPIIKYNTHPPLISEGTAKAIDQIFADNRTRRDKKTGKTYSLSGLVQCAACGAKCTISYPRMVCSNRRHGVPGTVCGDLVNQSKGRNQYSASPSIAANHDELEVYAIEQLCRRSSEIAETLGQEYQSEQAIRSDLLTAEELKVQEQVIQIEQLIASIGDCSGLLRQKIAELRSSLPGKPDRQVKIEEDEFLIRSGQRPEYWQSLSAKDRQGLFRRLIECILVDGDRIVGIRLKI